MPTTSPLLRKRNAPELPKNPFASPFPLSLYSPENSDFLLPAFLERGLPPEAAGVLALALYWKEQKG